MSTVRPSAPSAVRWIVRVLEEAGHETWAVGGAVRDALTGGAPGDWDLATSARPGEVRKIFRRTVPIGVEHGTVGVLARDGTMYEVTTFRRDVETDGRHAVVAFADTIEEDLARRDFTVNAVAWHPLREALLDPFGGAADLEAGVLRTVGEPAERFAEDYLRVLRALRFAGRFSLEIDGATWQALTVGVDRLRALSAERVRDELVKVLDADPAPARAMRLYAESGALAVLYPEIEALRRSGTAETTADPRVPDAWTIAIHSVEVLPVQRPLLRLAALVRDVEPEGVAALLTRLRFSNAAVDETAHRARGAQLPPPDESDASFRRWLSSVGPHRLPALARLDLARAKALCGLGVDDRVAAVVASWRRARLVRSAHSPLAVGDLALDGRGLISAGMRPGPEFGRILDALLDWVLDDPARNRRELLVARALELAGGDAGDV